MCRSRALLLLLLSLSCGRSSERAPLPAAEGSATHVAVGAGSSAVAAADVDKDDSIDLMVANALNGEITLLHGDGRGHFTPVSRAPAGTMPTDVAVADVNGDGNVDAVIANHETSLVTVLLGDGRGGFAAAPGSPFDTGARPHVHSVAVADLNGDGRLDAAVDSIDTDTVQVLWGGPQIFHSPAIAYPAGRHPYFSVAAGQVTGSGPSNLAVGNAGEGTVTILAADGQGGLAPTHGSPYATGTRDSFGVAIGDVTGEGRADVVVLNPSGGQVAVLRNEGAGVLRPAAGSPFATGRSPSNVALGDIDGDGLLDIVTSDIDGDDVTLLLSGPDRSLASTRRSITVNRRPEGLVVADFDGDGRADLAVTNAVDLLVWLSR